MEKTVLLNFEIDQSKAVRDYEKLEKVIIDNKTAQQELTKALKAGNITQEEYISEQARLSQNLSKETQQRNTLKKVIEAETGSVNAERAALARLVQQRNALNKTTDEGLKKFNALNIQIKQLTDSLKKAEQGGGDFRRNVGNYPELAQAAAQIKVAGVSLDDLTKSFSTFAGGATAIIGVLGAIGGAYAASATGARDLENAQIQLSTAYAVAGEEFAEFLNSGEESIGIVEGISIAFLTRYVPSVYAVSEAYAAAAKSLKDLEISRAFAAGDAKNDERRAEILRRIRDDESVALEDRIAASAKIDEILETSKQRTIIILQAEADAIRRSTVGYDKNREAQLKVAQLTAEIADKEEEITGKLTENVTARRTLIKLQQDELSLFGNEVREANKPDTNLVDPAKGNQLSDPAIQASEARISQFIKELDAVEFTEKQKQEFYRQSATIKQELDQQTFQATANIIGQAAGIFNEQTAAFKVLASAQTLMTTYSAAEKTYDSLAGIPYVGPYLGAAAAAVAVADGLARVARINGVQFAEGGYTGAGHKYQPAGIVHAGEVVWNQLDVAAVGGPSAADRMRPSYSGSVSRGTYANGGIVTSAVTRAADQQMLMMNVIKNLPVPEVSVKEITKAQKRIIARERTAKLAS